MSAFTTVPPPTYLLNEAEQAAARLGAKFAIGEHTVKVRVGLASSFVNQTNYYLLVVDRDSDRCTVTRELPWLPTKKHVEDNSIENVLTLAVKAVEIGMQVIRSANGSYAS